MSLRADRIPPRFATAASECAPVARMVWMIGTRTDANSFAVRTNASLPTTV
jgi:hypothetical protein